MEKSIIRPGAGGLIAVAIVSAIMACSIFVNSVNHNPIVSDGLENLTIAKNIISYSSFSAGSPENPDMAREPAWPVLAALVIYLASLENIPVDSLATHYSYVWKIINILIYAISIGIAASYFYFTTHNKYFLAFFLILTFALYGTMPWLINNFYNEALATLLVLINSILFYEIMKGRLIDSRYFAPVLFGILSGFLALTKAQFLYICIPVIFILLVNNKKKAFIIFLAMFFVCAPWIYRNYTLFGEPAIANRGKTVAAVRIILTSEPTPQEYPCMAYAFSHPEIQPYLESFLGVKKFDFSHGEKCQKLNRELCFYMGTIRVRCEPFPEDIYSTDWKSKVQYFYRGHYAGRLIEKNQLSFKNIAVFDSKFAKNYLKTLPLFAWRGFGFSDYPLFSVIVSFSVFGLLLTPYWPLALLCVSSQLFHIFFTHNVPRYHAIEFPVLVFSAICLLWLFWSKYFRPLNLFGRKSIREEKKNS